MDIGELQRQVEYKFAPEPLIAIQALANTYAFEADEELLSDPDAARKWLLDSGLATAETTVSVTEWQQLIDLRKAVRSQLEANLTGEPDSAADTGLRKLAEQHPVTFKVGERGELELDVEPVESVGAVTAQMIGIIFQAQRQDQWRRLKVCASDECRWAFYDSSRNRGGTWCKMETCGNRINNRRYRQRTG